MSNQAYNAPTVTDWTQSHKLKSASSITIELDLAEVKIVDFCKSGQNEEET